ncbi:hypothetical protein DFH06DRAFT_1161376 [Mycena polygramma]|nr:hypothetical protein DFH06DRAFT_1161376 [Mycena polygramma]
MSSAMSSTQAQQASQEDRDDDKEDEEEEEESPHSTHYAPFMRIIIRYICSKLPHLISPKDVVGDPPTDTVDLALFNALSNEAQMLLTCLLMRKDMKWQTSWRLEKLGDRLELRDGKLERVIDELCTIPQTSPPLSVARFFARDESKMTEDERLRCLRVDHLHKILGESRLTRKNELIVALQQSGQNIWPEVNEILGKCIQISEHVVRLFRRLILAYYWCERDGIRRDISDGPPSARRDIMDGVGKRFRAFTPMIFCDPPFFHNPPFVRSRQALVGFEEEMFPNPASLKLAAVDNYLLIFNDILGNIKVEDGTNVTESCGTLDVATRHVLGSVLLQRKRGVSSSDLRQLGSVGVFDPEDENVIATVIAKLCGSATGDFAFCTDESQEQFQDVLERLKIEDLKEIAKRHYIMTKGAKVKTDWIQAFMRALPQRRLNTRQPLREILMPDVISKLKNLKKRQLLLKQDVGNELKALIESYFERRAEAPAYIAQRPFRAMRRRCLGLE